MAKREEEAFGGSGSREDDEDWSVKSVPDPNKGIFDGRKYCSAD